MNLRENLVVALRGLSANKLRSSLTVLGILIGVGSVILLVAVGNGSSAAVQKNIRALGTNTITVINRGRFGRGPETTATQSQAATITPEDITALGDKSQAPDVANANPVVTSSVTATFGQGTTTTTVDGTTPTYLGAEDYQVQAGRNITSSDVTGHDDVVLIGQTFASDLFGSGVDPLGDEILLGSGRFQVVGILASKGSSGTTDQNDVAIVPYTSAEDLITGYPSSFSELIIQATSGSTTTAAEDEAAAILASANDTSVADLPFTIVNQSSLLATSQQTNETFTVLLGAVAAISLLVGGIGIMNIMLVTVTERTREIGIRKAIGAPRSAIVGQFLTEAVLLSLIGGLTGVVIGLVGSRFTIVGVHPVVSVASIFEAFGVAVAVGIIFGLYPANRAAALRPIDALRYE